MKIAVVGAGHIGSTVGRLWHAAGHEVTFAAQDAAEPRTLAAELGEHAHAATVADAVAAADVVLMAVPGPAVVDVLTAAGSLNGRVVIDAANMMDKDRLSLGQLAGMFPQARWVRAFNTLQARVLADENHRQPRWALFLSGDETAKPAVAQLITDAGFEPADLGGVDDSQFQEPGSALWNTTLDAAAAKELAGRVRAIRNNAKIEATVKNAQELLAILHAHDTIRGYLASFPDAHAAAADLHRRFRFLGDTGVWRLLTSAAGDLG
jgi:8-hydroxy-5-deazaflavin:NADPH oxidoreductase